MQDIRLFSPLYEVERGIKGVSIKKIEDKIIV